MGWQNLDITCFLGADRRWYHISFPPSLWPRLPLPPRHVYQKVGPYSSSNPPLLRPHVFVCTAFPSHKPKPTLQTPSKCHVVERDSQKRKAKKSDHQEQGPGRN